MSESCSVPLFSSNNQRLANAGGHGAFLAIWVMKDLGAHREKGFALWGFNV